MSDGSNPRARGLPRTDSLARPRNAFRAAEAEAFKSPSHDDALSRRAALDGPWRRPRSRPYLLDTSARCVLARNRPSHPGDEAPSCEGLYLTSWGSNEKPA